MSDQTTPVNKPKRRKFFNIDAMARKFYPFGKVCSPNRLGVVYNQEKVHCISPESQRHYIVAVLKRAA